MAPELLVLNDPAEPKAFPILADVRVRQNNMDQQLAALLDTGASDNFMSYRYLVEKGIQLENAGMAPPVGYANGGKAPCYGTVTMKAQVFDSGGRMRNFGIPFYVIDLAADQYQAVLGRKWMAYADPDILLSLGNWHWRKQSKEVHLEGAETFFRSMKRNPTIMVMYRPQPDGGPEPGLPSQYTDWSEVFSEVGASQLPTQSAVHEIPLEPGAQPPFGRLYSLSQAELKVLKEYLDKMLERGWIRPSQSSAGAPVLFVKKPDGSLRLCVDYRGLNAITHKNRYPLPRIDELMDRFVHARYFTKLDLRDAYHRIRIKKGDEWKTAFRTRYGHFEYLVMPFGLTNAPATFQAYINTAMRGILDDYCVVYLDDILIYSETAEEHERHVKEVLERLRRHSLYAKLSKCEFHQPEVKFLGFIVGRGGLRIDPDRSRTVSGWPEPRSFHEVQVFVGFVNYFRRFIYQFSKVTQPLTDLLKGMKNGRKSGPFHMTTEAKEAFKELKARFTEPPVLHHFNPGEPILLITDASGFAVAGILAQVKRVETAKGKVKKQWAPIAFHSRKLNIHELRYEVHDQELLAIVECFKEWRHYLQGSTHAVRVQTDHNNLRYFFKTKVLNQRQARWAELLAAYDFEIEYKPGRMNPADAPSRRRDYEPADKEHAIGLLPTLQKKLGGSGSGRTGGDSPPVDSGGPLKQGTVAASRGPELLSLRSGAVEAARSETGCGPVTLSLRQRLVEAQAGDAHAGQIRRRMVTAGNTQPGSGNPRLGGWREEDGLLLHNKASYVPPIAALQHEIIRVHHDAPWAGHYGFKRTLELLQRKFCWKGMRPMVDEYVKTYTICQQMKVPKHRPQGSLASLPIPEGPWQDVTMDFITGLPPSGKGSTTYDAILVVVDRYSKAAKYIPTTQKVNAEGLADLFLAEVVYKTGSPRSIVTDRGTLFTSGYWRSFCQELQIKGRLSTAFHPQTDGQTERQNQTLESYLRVYCNFRQDDWASWLPAAEFAYNNSRNESTGISPFMAWQGSEPAIPGLETFDGKAANAAVEDRVRQMTIVRDQLQENLKASQARQALQYNKKHRPTIFPKGQKVWLSTKNIRTWRPSKKLDKRYDGPFEIIKPVGKQAYRLRFTGTYANSRIHPVFHVSLLKEYHEREGEKPTRPDAELVDDAEEWEVEEIVGDRRYQGKNQFLVK